MQKKHNERGDLVELLKKIQVIKFGKFKLSSGRTSDYYVDMKKAITNPEILAKIARIIVSEIGSEKIDKVAGPAVGAIPIVTAVSLKSGIPMLIIRKEKKDYGTTNLIEGDLEDGDSVVVCEDVTTTGGSLLKAIEAINENGGAVRRAFVVVDRCEGALKNLQRVGIKLEPLLSIEDFKKIGVE